MLVRKPARRWPGAAYRPAISRVHITESPLTTGIQTGTCHMLSSCRLTIRLVFLGTGTNVGKTYVATQLARALAAHSSTISVTAIKPVESGTDANREWNGRDLPLEQKPSRPPLFTTDAAVLSAASTPNLIQPRYAYEFRDPVSPHLAARRSGTSIDPSKVIHWVSAIERARHNSFEPQAQPSLKRSGYVEWTLIETAGAVFSPLARGVDNLALAAQLEPALWILVAPDRLGLLHDMTATLTAMRLKARSPDFVVLSGSQEEDLSTGTNAEELAHLGIAEVLTTIAANAPFPPSALDQLVNKAVAATRQPPPQVPGSSTRPA